jgi:hypothetical protein
MASNITEDGKVGKDVIIDEPFIYYAEDENEQDESFYFVMFRDL